MCTKRVFTSQEISKLSDFCLSGKIDRYLEKKNVFKKFENA